MNREQQVEDYTSMPLRLSMKKVEGESKGEELYIIEAQRANACGLLMGQALRLAAGAAEDSRLFSGCSGSQCCRHLVA